MLHLCVLGTICGPEKVQTARELGSLHYEELYDVTNTIRVIKSRTLRWAGHVARMGEGEECMQDFGGETRRNEGTCNT